MVRDFLLFLLLSRWRGRGNSNSFMLLLFGSSTLRLHNPLMSTRVLLGCTESSRRRRWRWSEDRRSSRYRFVCLWRTTVWNWTYITKDDVMWSGFLRLRLAEYCLCPLVYYILVPLHTIIISDIVQKEKCQTKWEKCLSSTFLSAILGKDVFRFIKYTSYVRSSSWRIRRWWWANLI